MHDYDVVVERLTDGAMDRAIVSAPSVSLARTLAEDRLSVSSLPWRIVKITALRHRTGRRPRFRFTGRGGDRYYWEAPMPNDSRVEQVSCPVDWFWRPQERKVSAV